MFISKKNVKVYLNSRYWYSNSNEHKKNCINYCDANRPPQGHNEVQQLTYNLMSERL